MSIPIVTPADLESLVYDRTQADGDTFKLYIQAGYAQLSEYQKAEWDSLHSKGAWNYTDLNRVELWIDYLIQLLAYSGANTSDITAFDATWDAVKNLYSEDVTERQHSIELIRQRLNVTPEDWATLVSVTDWNYSKANALEKDLQLLYNAISQIYVWPICGAATCGGDYL